MEPAQTIISRLGGEVSIAAIAGTAVSAPYRWRYPREQGGTGGLIPQRHHPALLAYARANGIALDASDFLPVIETTAPSPQGTALHRPATATPPLESAP